MYCDFQLYNILLNADFIICIFEFLPFSSFFLTKLIKMIKYFCTEWKVESTMMLITSRRWHFLSSDCNFRSFLRREFFYPQLCVLIFFKGQFCWSANWTIRSIPDYFKIILNFFFLFCIIYHWLWYFKLRYMVYNKYNLHVLNCFIMTLEDIITFACTIFNHTVLRVTN